MLFPLSITRFVNWQVSAPGLLWVPVNAVILGLAAAFSFVPRRRHSVPTILLSLGLCVLLLTQLYMAWTLSSDQQVRYIMKNGQVIISAILAYANDHGVHPASLDELVPTYVAHLPKANRWVEADWGYTTDDERSSYYLSPSVLHTSHSDFSYDSTNGTWNEDY